MTLHQFIIILVSYTALSLGIYVFQLNKTSPVNRMFFVVAFLASYNAFIRFMLTVLSPDKMDKFADSFDIFWALTLPAVVHFVIFLADDKRAYKSPLWLILLYLPAAVLTYIQIFMPALYRTGTGPAVGYSYYSLSADIILIGQALAVIFSSVYYYVKARNREKKIKMAYVAVSISLVCIIMPFEYGVLPKFGIKPMDITILALIISMSLIAYAIKKFSVLKIDPATVAMNILSTINEYVFLLDPALNTLSVNQPAVKGLGINAEEIKKMKFYEYAFLHGGDRIDLRLILKEGGSISGAEGDFRKPDGKLLPVMFSVSPVRDSSNELAGYVCAAIDISERKKLIDNLREAVRILGEKNLEIESRSQELSDSYEQLKTLDKMKNNFISIISHELRTPLTSIKGFLAFLEKGVAGPLNNQQHEYTGIIRSNTDRLLKLINELLDLSRIEAGTFTIVKKNVDIIKIIEAAINEMTPIADAKHIKLVEDSALSSFVVSIDEYRISQVIINLINNSIKFSPGGATVAVTVDALIGAKVILPPSLAGNFIYDRDYVLVSVTDSGRGISEEQLEKVFDKFYQVEETNVRKYQGAGLGLSIVREIIRSHGGEVWAESEGEGKGSVFKFVIPV